jgi:hypothetical protein
MVFVRVFVQQHVSPYRTASCNHLSRMRITGKGGKNRRRGKGDGEESKRELEFKEDGTLVLVLCVGGFLC